MPLGQEPTPSAWAASSMFWTARPASMPAPPFIVDGDDERGAADVARLEDRLGDGLDGVVVADDEEGPRLAVLRAAGQAARVEDRVLDLGLERARGVLAHLAPADDGQVGVHRRQASARGASGDASAAPVRWRAGLRRELGGLGGVDRQA